MKSMFSQNRIGSARLGTANTGIGNVNSYLRAYGFRFCANTAKQLSSLTTQTQKVGTPADNDLPIYLCQPFLGVAYKIGVVTSGAATITLNGHRLANAERILMFGVTLPTGASARGTLYWVVNAATNTFSLSLTQGGAAITWSSTGTTVAFARVLDYGTFTMSGVTGALSYYNCNGFTYTFIVGKLYYFLMTNHNATPASNYLNWSVQTNVFETSNDMGYCNTVNITVLTQDTLSIGLNGSLNYSDGTKLECRVASVGTSSIYADSGAVPYYRGFRFKTMPDAKVRLIAVAWKAQFTIPTATTISKNYVCELLDNSDTLIATSQTINNLDYTTATIGLIPFCFDTVQVLEASTTYKLRVRTTYTGADTTCAMLFYYVNFALDSTGTYYHKQVWNDGSNAVMYLDSFNRINGDTSDSLQPQAFYINELWLDDTDPYNAVSGGGGLTSFPSVF